MPDGSHTIAMISGGQVRTHMYLTAIIDWFSRKIVGWTLSDTLDTKPILEAVGIAMEQTGIPVILNSDQGSQFTSDSYRKYLKDHHIRQSMDGKSRWADNILTVRHWPVHAYAARMQRSQKNVFQSLASLAG